MHPIRKQCRFCGGHGKRGTGCLACDAALDEEYRRQFPNGPAPLLTFNREDPADMDLLKRTMQQTMAPEVLLGLKEGDPTRTAQFEAGIAAAQQEQIDLAQARAAGNDEYRTEE